MGSVISTSPFSIPETKPFLIHPAPLPFVGLLHSLKLLLLHEWHGRRMPGVLHVDAGLQVRIIACDPYIVLVPCDNLSPESNEPVFKVYVLPESSDMDIRTAVSPCAVRISVMTYIDWAAQMDKTRSRCLNALGLSTHGFESSVNVDSLYSCSGRNFPS